MIYTSIILNFVHTTPQWWHERWHELIASTLHIEPTIVDSLFIVRWKPAYSWVAFYYFFEKIVCLAKNVNWFNYGKNSLLPSSTYDEALSNFCTFGRFSRTNFELFGHLLILDGLWPKLEYLDSFLFRITIDY